MIKTLVFIISQRSDNLLSHSSINQGVVRTPPKKRTFIWYKIQEQVYYFHFANGIIKKKCPLSLITILLISLTYNY